MKTISIKIEKSILKETEKIISKLEKPRNIYINEAIVFYNKFQKRIFLEEKLKKESSLVSKNSMAILNDFEKIENRN